MKKHKEKGIAKEVKKNARRELQKEIAAALLKISVQDREPSKNLNKIIQKSAAQLAKKIAKENGATVPTTTAEQPLTETPKTAKKVKTTATVAKPDSKKK